MSRRRYVYFVEAGEGGPIKIGVAIDVAARVKDLQSANPTPLRLIVSIPGGYEEEGRLHRRFADERLNSEWFRGDGEVRALALSLLHASPDERTGTAEKEMAPRRREPKRAKKGRTRRRHLTPEQWHALFFVGDSGSVYRSAEAEQVIAEENERRRSYGLAPQY